jgi:hypothetical protein
MSHHPCHCIINLQSHFHSAIGLTSQYLLNQKTLLMLPIYPCPLYSNICIRLLYSMAVFLQSLSEWDALLSHIITITMQLMLIAVDVSLMTTTQAC